MEKFSFFNDVNDDRVYYAEDWARHLKKYFTNGIFNNELNVLVNNDMTITIKEGDANIEGYRYTNTGDLVKTIEMADGTLNRIDNVVLRLDLTNRLISAQIIKGTFADKPVAPELVRTSTIYDLRIAKISIPAGTTTITQDLITDTRFITSDCGNVISTVQTPDTENLFIQMQTLFEKQINELNNNFETWFDSMKNQLSSDAAGNLQNQINDLNSNKADNATYDLDSNNLQLLANGKNVGDSVHIPTGITDEVSGEENLKIINNKGVVKFSLDGKTEQKTYTGKNLLNYIDNLQNTNGLTNTINSDESITTTGTPTKDFAYITKDYVITDMLEDGQNYTISQAIASNKLYLQINARKKSDKTYIHIAINSDNVKSKSFKVDKSTYDLYSVNIQTTAMSLWGSSSLTITNKYMLCKGTDTADTSFEPYVGGQVSPSPNYPQKIKNVRGVENILPNSLAQGSWNTTNTLTRVANYSNVYLKAGTYVFSSDIDITKYKVWLGTSTKKLPHTDWNIINEIQSWIPLKKYTFTIKNDGYFLVMYRKADDSNITPSELSNLKQQLEEGSIAHDFVPYGSNYLQLENVGENILNIDETPFTVKKITSQGNVLYWSGYSGVNDFVKVKEKTTYKFSSNEVNKVCYIDYYDKNKNYLSRTGTAVDYFTTPENCKYIKFAINLELIPTNAQLREGTIIKSYEPYKKKIINIDLKGNNLCSNKEQTLKDELVIENGRAKIIKKYDEYVFTGNETFSFTDNGARIMSNTGRISQLKNVYISIPQSSSNITPSFCTHYTVDGQGNVVKGSNKFGFSQYDNAKFIYFPADYSTIEEFKAKLKALYDAGTPVIVQYPLSEPEIIDLGKVDLDLLEGNSTLNLEEDLKSNMSIKYYTDSTVVDLKKKVENKQNVILHGTTIPSNDLGEDGDIYLQHN
jgi:hypothetical protein